MTSVRRETSNWKKNSLQDGKADASVLLFVFHRSSKSFSFFSLKNSVGSARHLIVSQPLYFAAHYCHPVNVLKDEVLDPEFELWSVEKFTLWMHDVEAPLRREDGSIEGL